MFHAEIILIMVGLNMFGVLILLLNREKVKLATQMTKDGKPALDSTIVTKWGFFYKKRFVIKLLRGPRYPKMVAFVLPGIIWTWLYRMGRISIIVGMLLPLTFLSK